MIPHRPYRLCLGCGERAPQLELLRVKLDPAGKLVLASGAGQPGRSGYLHAQASCWQRFAARKGPVRSLARSFDRDARRAFVIQLQDSIGNTRPEVESR